jgi:peptide/nickel transport system substrate-binding protein
MKTRKTLLVLSLIIVFSMVLGACAQPETVVETVEVVTTVEVVKEGETVVETQVVVVTATPEPTEAPPPTAVPQPSDTVVLALQQEPDTLHPLIGSMMARTIVNSTWQVTCMGQNEKAEWINLGCEGEVPTIDNGGAVFVGEGADKHLEVTHKIRDDWRWTDGTPVTTKDPIYQWKLTMDPAMEVAGRTGTEKIYDIVAVDDKTYTVVFMSEAQAKAAAAGTLTGNVDFAAFLADYEESGYANQVGPVVDPVYLTFGTGWLPEHAIGSIPAAEQASIDWTKVPGDGAYYLKEWKQGQEIVLEKSDQPFPLGDAAIKTVIYRFFAETAAVIAALQNGEIDAVTGTGGLTVANAPDLDQIEATGTYKMIYEPGYQWEHIDINTTKFPFDDPLVRKAMYHSIDRQGLVDNLYFGKQAVTNLPVPEGLSWAYTDNITKYEYDPEKAKALLAEAGWNCEASPCTKEIDGEVKPLAFTLMTTDRADRQAVAQVIQQQLKANGFGVNLQFLYGRGLFATADAGGPLSSRTFDAAIYTWITGDDPGHLGQYDCANIPSEANNFSGQNYPGMCDQRADELLTMNETDPEISLSREKRKPVLEEFYQIWTDLVPVIPLFSNTRVYVARPGFENFKPGPTQFAADGWNAWEWKLSK